LLSASVHLETHWRASAVPRRASGAASTTRARGFVPAALPSPRKAKAGALFFFFFFFFFFFGLETEIPKFNPKLEEEEEERALYPLIYLLDRLTVDSDATILVG
jgi:hypothetical protein